jgi:hypothetical protein
MAENAVAIPPYKINRNILDCKKKVSSVCIALSNMDKIWQAVKAGTTIEIQP